MTDWISPSWLVEALVASSVLMVVVLLLRRPVRKAFGADVAYALWLLPVLRLALPPLPAAWHDATVAPVLRATEQMTVLLVEPTETAVATAAAAPAQAWLVPLLAVLWIAGAGAFVVWHTLAHHRFCRRMLDQAASSEQHGAVRVIETSAASGPLAFGVWRRYVAFPRDFAERFEPEERDLALAHELGHHARGDLIANWVALVVLSVHWFNPIAWRAFRAFRADQEIANDARVLAGMNPMRRHTYACAILKAAHPTFLGGTVSATCHLHTIDDLKGRLKMLTTIKTSRVRLIGGGTAIAALALGGLGLTASGSQAADRMRSGVQRATGIDIAALAPPAAAAPPAPEAPSSPTRFGAPSHPHRSSSAPDAPAAPVAPIASVEDGADAAPPEPSEPAHLAHRPGTTVMVTVDADGKRIVRYGSYVKLRRDGAVMIGEIAPMPPIAPIAPIPPIPPVSITSKPCGAGGLHARTVIAERRDGGARIIVCSDRVAAIAARGAAIAANSADMERTAYSRALEGLRASRARLVASQDMAGIERKAALAGVDTAIAELEDDLAKAR